MEPNSTLGEPIGVVHVTINGQKVPANVYADRTCIMPDGTIRKVKQEVVDALLAKKRAAEIPAQTPAQQAPAAQPFITRVQSQPVVQPVQPAAPQPAVQTPQTTMQYRHQKVQMPLSLLILRTSLSQSWSLNRSPKKSRSLICLWMMTIRRTPSPKILIPTLVFHLTPAALTWMMKRTRLRTMMLTYSILPMMWMSMKRNRIWI